MPSKEQLEALKKKKSQITAQISEMHAKIKTQDRKDETRIKILIGAAMMAEAKAQPKIKTFLDQVLKSRIKEKRNIEFLQKKGWMKEP
ncbi:MAG TPA: mobilization protein [Rhodospirillaceae bacterium]|nr:mobilization protein [Rhodospirillaceae bacterium]